MSLWTPGGEHPVDPSNRGGASDDATADEPQTTQEYLDSLSPDDRAQAEQMMAEMQEVRQRIAETPAAVVVVNHAMGLYELAAIHLSQQPPNLDEAKVGIDAFGALVEALAGRLGEDEGTLTDALAQLRLAFVQLSTGGGAGESGAGDEPG